MANMNSISWDDTILPFQLDNADVRGRVARLDGVLGQVLAQHNYPAPIEALIAETALLVALIGQTMKLRWKLSIQIRSDGPARIVAADYYAPEKAGEPAKIRAYASFDETRLSASADPFSQIGNGYFAILIDQGSGTEPYQGITPLDQGSLSACAEAYFSQSEQIPTRFQLAFGRSTLAGGQENWLAGGIMIQQMPEASPFLEGNSKPKTPSQDTEAQQENWNRANILLESVDHLELVGPKLTPTELLIRLFHQEIPRIFDVQKVEFGCSCSEDKVRQSMSIYSTKDISHMTTSEGFLTADCQFCGAHYKLDPKTLGFEASEKPDENQ